MQCVIVILSNHASTSCFSPVYKPPIRRYDNYFGAALDIILTSVSEVVPWHSFNGTPRGKPHLSLEHLFVVV